MKKLISVVVPFYNEEGNVQKLYLELIKVFDSERDKYNFEIIAVEHGSKDSTFEKLVSLHKKDKRVKILRLSKNFGNADAGICAGLAFASGEAAVIIMADLQEPPSLIPRFLRKWEIGYETVYGIVKKRPSDVSPTRRILSVLFYKILNLVTGNIFPENVSDFRLIDKKVYSVINQMRENNKYLRGLISWTGFKQTGIEFERAPRFVGKSKADFLTVLKVALNGIFSFSYVPLRIATILGLVVSFVSFLLIIVQIILVTIYGRIAPGQSTIVAAIGFFFGILFLMLGIIGEYLSRIYDEVKDRPSFIVKDKFGFDKSNK